MQADKTQVLNRLATIQGHLHGIRKMVEADVSCRDILRQTYALTRALNAFEVALLDSHLRSEFTANRGNEAIRGLSELFDLPDEDPAASQVDARLAEVC